MKAKIIFYLATLQIWLYMQWLKIAPKIGEFLYWFLCHLDDHWRIYVALIVGYILGG